MMTEEPKGHKPRDPKPLTSRQLAKNAMKTTPMPPLIELNRDLREAAKNLSITEVRYLVDQYYAIQDYRKASGNQIVAMTKADEPCSLIAWLFSNMDQTENEIRRWLDIYTDNEKSGVGKWCKGITGIGPVITAGLMSHIDIRKAPTAGHIWRFAGLEPSLKWLGAEGARKLLGQIMDLPDESQDYGEQGDPYAMTEQQLSELSQVIGNDHNSVLSDRQLVAVSRLSGRSFPSLLRGAVDDKGNITKASLLRFLAKRPWNAALKRLCYLAGDCFVKTCNLKGSFYGPLYMARKLKEIERNESGQLAEQAAAALAAKNYSKDTDAYKAYSQGRLPDAHIHARATRWTVKLFLSHYQQKAYVLTFGKQPPKPWVIEHGGHADYIAPPD